MFYADTERKRFTKWRIDLAIHDALAIAHKRFSYDVFQRLLTIALSRSDLLRPLPLGGYVGWTHVERILRGLLAICEHRRSWLREVWDWDVPEGSQLHQFGSLAEHLLASHPLPNFMRLVWFEEPSKTAKKHQRLYRHLGLGNNVRGADLPIRFTKSMANFFAEAPDHLTVDQAVRWSQIRGLGGDKRFASAVLPTRLGTVFENESFWAEALRFLIAQPKLDLEMIPTIVEFINVHRDGLADRPLSISERSFGSFLGRVRKWMDRNPNYGRQAKLRWPRTSIGGFRFVEPQKHKWSVRY